MRIRIPFVELMRWASRPEKIGLLNKKELREQSQEVNIRSIDGKVKTR